MMFMEQEYRIKTPKLIDFEGIELSAYLNTDTKAPSVRLCCTESNRQWHLSRDDFFYLLEEADQYEWDKGVFYVQTHLVKELEASNL